jgi:hypothetical protein
VHWRGQGPDVDEATSRAMLRGDRRRDAYHRDGGRVLRGFPMRRQRRASDARRGRRRLDDGPGSQSVKSVSQLPATYLIRSLVFYMYSTYNLYLALYYYTHTAAASGRRPGPDWALRAQTGQTGASRGWRKKAIIPTRSTSTSSHMPQVFL